MVAPGGFEPRLHLERVMS